jgi:hypothetical protein
VAKTKVMVVQAECFNSSSSQPVVITIGGEILEIVDKFRYLGSIESNGGHMKHEVCRLKQSMYGAFEKLKHVFMDRKLNMGIRLSVFNSVVLQQGLYGCQGWNLQVEDMRALESVYGRLLRRTIGIRDPNMPAIDVIAIAREHNDRIYPLECQIRQTQLRYMGHVVRRDGSGRPQVTREVAYGYVEGDAKGGGHLLDFKRMVKASLEMFNIPTDSWESIARSEKDRWRKML